MLSRQCPAIQLENHIVVEEIAQVIKTWLEVRMNEFKGLTWQIPRFSYI